MQSNNKKQYTISIDSSTSKSGVAVFQIMKSGKYNYIKHQLFESEEAKYTSKKKGMTKTAYKAIHSKEKREHMEYCVVFMMEHIEDVLNNYKPTIVVMEDTYGQNDMMTLKMLSRIQGCVVDWCRRNKAEIVFKTPAKWRVEVGMPIVDASGNRLKREQFKEFSKNIVKQVFGMDVTDDEADAICIGLSMTDMLK